MEIKITNMSLSDENGPTIVFSGISSAICISMDVHISPDLWAFAANNQTRIEAKFMVLDPLNHTVIWSGTWPHALLRSLGGPDFYLSVGNCWGPPSDYTTPEQMGLNFPGSYDDRKYVFGAYGMVYLLDYPYVFDVFSTFKWFMVKPETRID